MALVTFSTIFSERLVELSGLIKTLKSAIEGLESFIQNEINNIDILKGVKEKYITDSYKKTLNLLTELNDKEISVTTEQNNNELIDCLKDINENISDLHDAADNSSILNIINALNSIAVFVILCIGVMFAVMKILG